MRGGREAGVSTILEFSKEFELENVSNQCVVWKSIFVCSSFCEKMAENDSELSRLVFQSVLS